MSTEPHDSSPHRHLAGLRPDLLMAQGRQEMADDPLPPELPGYEIESLIGRGGMGVVYLARQVGLDRQVAIKRVACVMETESMLLERLAREAKTMASLQHPNVVTIHHFEALQEGGAVIVMEYVAGGNLRDRIDAHPLGMPVDEVRRLIRGIASALASAHASQVMHRDMKPENVLIGNDGAARVTDFGLAVSLDRESTRLTLPGTTLGTMDYLAPECFKSSEPDARSDIYSLGVILYEMLTGRAPRGSFVSPRQVRPGIPRSLSDCAIRALRPDPDERFGSVEDFISALDGRTSRRSFLAVATGGIALAAGIWGYFRSTAPPRDSVETKTPKSGEWKNMIESADLTAGTISGGWKMENGAFVTNDAICILALEKEMPVSYDVRAVFTRLRGIHSIAIFFTANGTVGSVDIDGWGQGLAGVQSISGRDLRQGEGFSFSLENGRSYELLVEVRPGNVTVSIDGEVKGEFPISSKALGIVEPWAWNPGVVPAALGIGSYESPTRFEVIQWRKIGW